MYCFRFISADKSVGAQGFHAVWTEVQDDSDCNQFSCAKTSYCIADRLRCNSVANCGQDDTSDEQNCESLGVLVFFLKYLLLGFHI